jgi:hypothetical protein
MGRKEGKEMRQEKEGKGKKGRTRIGGKLPIEGIERKGRMGGEKAENRKRTERRRRMKGENRNRGEREQGRMEKRGGRVQGRMFRGGIRKNKESGNREKI